MRQTFRDLGHLIAVDYKRIGPGFLRNLIVKQSAAEWLVFLDDDDLLDPEFVELHLKEAVAQQADMVYALPRYPPRSEWRPPITAFDPRRLLAGPYIPITALVRRSTFDEVGGFRITNNCEDHRLWLDMMKIGARFRHLPKVCWTYRLHGRAWEPEVA